MINVTIRYRSKSIIISSNNRHGYLFMKMFTWENVYKMQIDKFYIAISF